MPHGAFAENTGRGTWMKKTESLKKNYEFSRVYKKGRFFAGKFIVMHTLKNKYSFNRLGITVSTKFGKSVKRNRIRRLIRENYRINEDFIREGYDIVFVARKQDSMPSYRQVGKEMKFLMTRLGMLKQNGGWSC